MSEVERLSITQGEYHALNMIRGLGSSAFYLVVCAKQDKDERWVLEGSPDAFDELTSDLSDEIYHELSPPTRLKHLRKLYNRLSPGADEF